MLPQTEAIKKSGAFVSFIRAIVVQQSVSTTRVIAIRAPPSLYTGSEKKRVLGTRSGPLPRNIIRRRRARARGLGRRAEQVYTDLKKKEMR